MPIGGKEKGKGGEAWRKRGGGEGGRNRGGSMGAREEEKEGFNYRLFPIVRPPLHLGP